MGRCTLTMSALLDLRRGEHAFETEPTFDFRLGGNVDTAWLEEQRLQRAQCLVFISVDVLFNELAEVLNFGLVAQGSLQHGIADKQRPGLAALF
jgi:hypothetical protein